MADTVRHASVWFGGYRNIRWLKGDRRRAQKLSTPGIPPIHPIALALESVEIAGIFLQWWELRKQTFLQAAQFEERRIPWLVDMLAQWYAEIEQGTLRLDTSLYVDREISRLLDRIEENDLIDLPSSLLLHIERSSHLLVTMNGFIKDLIVSTRPNQVQEGRQAPPSVLYRPFYELAEDSKIGEYIDTSDKYIKTVARPAALMILSPIAGLLWGASRLSELTKKIRGRERLAEFMPLRNFAIELRSTNSLLSELQALPTTVREYYLTD